MNLTEQIESVILSNFKLPDKQRIGIEHEIFFYDNNIRRILVNPADEFSATDLLNEMLELQSEDVIKSGYSLEPGGQLEWASPPLQSIHEINKHFSLHKKRVLKIIKREQLKIVNYSLEPLFTPNDIDLINHKKYQLMDKMFNKTGKLGPWMMRNTTSTQINIDFSSKTEAERMAYIADCLTPLASILFANSPFWQGKTAGTENLRYKIWQDTDATRCGDLFDHNILKPQGLIRDYAKYVQTVPAIFVTDKNGDFIEFNGTLGKWLTNLESAGILTDEHIQAALHQIFTNVRFKNVLEIRGADRPPQGHDFAPAAFWSGLLLDNETQLKVFEIIKKWTKTERKYLIACANYLDLNQIGPQKKTIEKWIKIISDLALAGLDQRSKHNKLPNDRIFLENYLEDFKKQGIPALYHQKRQEKSRKSVDEFIQHSLCKSPKNID